MPARVLITGLGCVSCFGMGHAALWSALMEGRSGLKRISRFDPSGFESRVAGEIADPPLDARDFVPKSYRKATKVMARDTEIAVAAAKLAVEDAGLITKGNSDDETGANYTYKVDRLGCNIGAGLIAAELDEMAAAMVTARPEGEFSLRAWGGEGGKGMEALTPLWLLKYLPNMLACHVTIIHGAEGPSNTITCAEASGLLSVGESMRIIERGGADVCFSGAAESKLNPMGMLRLDFAGRLARTGDAADGSAFVRPFDPAATGGVVGEGGAIVMLENADTARARGARAYAEVVGFGGGHSDARYKKGQNDEGYRYAIENALDDAGIKPDDIDVIVPLAMGVPEMDRPEAGALKAVFAQRLPEIGCITIQPNAGNCVAGAGGLQMVAAALALHNQELPARLHAGGAGPIDGLPVGACAARKRKLRYALLCAGSLGGQDGAVVLKSVG
ncbi:MAG TPA: beta-ketoacyl synthase N-terminal-like domain-containing protein [Phycisphaerales bacterium]|nr:beta-ketoacyl synthase N-terminal-like domain-containing protein [Phycisphaerales bacterium]